MPRYFDGDLPRVGADKLKPMVKIWGGSYKMSKYACIDFIVAALKDPARVQAAVASLQPWERNALALIKRMGGVTQANTLKIGIFASGVHPPRAHNYRDDFVEALFRRGLILAMDTYSPEHIREEYGRGGMLYSDERILAQVGFPEFKAFDIQPMPAPGETHYRRPSAVTLDVVGMLQTIENMGGLKLTQNGTVRVNDEAKLRKALHWDEKGVDLDGFFFPRPAEAWLSACAHSDLLAATGDRKLVVKEPPERFARRSYGEQVRLLLEGLIRSSAWWETTPKSSYFDEYGKGRRQGRLAITQALSALPLNPDAFFSFKDFEQRLYDRIGEDFALDYPPRRPYFFRSTTEEQQRQDLAAWQEKTRQEWLKQEYSWLVGAFTTWLYFLGLVELARENGQLVAFRLTEIGRTTFHPKLASDSPTESSVPASSQPAWVVQPNFDIIVYLDRVSPLQLAFLERHTERTQAHRHTAHYRLTRESVYRGLESGTTLDDLLKELQIGSEAELPQNILVELREWDSFRDRIILHRNAWLMEFPSAQALRAGLTQGLAGSVVAERFLLLDANSASNLSGSTNIDYAHPLPKNLSITETGTIRIRRSSDDLVTTAQLTQWANRKADGEWQLTAESVSAALKPGRKFNELLVFLKSRLSHPLPHLLEIALRSWAGENFTVELESVIILHCPQEQVFQAVIASPLIKALLRGYLLPDLLFVDPKQIEILRQHLQWLGWDVSDQLQTIPLGIHSKIEP